jgi:hypothetical protein
MARELALIALVVAGAGLGGIGCDRGAKATPAGTPLASKPFYRVDPGAGSKTACTVGAVCEARLALTALGDYHVNKEYPFKFVGEPPPAAPLAGEATFKLDDARTGTMTIKFRPSASGTARVVGTFKLSVCSDDTCEIEAPKIELAVPVS